MTHAFRSLGRWIGPRRSGLMTGMPSTTALMLVGCGLDRGLDEANLAAEACLVGLVAASALPVAYARSAAAGWRIPWAAAAAVGGYVTVALALWVLPRLDAAGSVAVAGLGLLATCRLAARVRVTRSPDRGRGRPLSRHAVFAFRTAIPTGYFLTIRLLRALGGSAIAGRFITFPGGSLAVLVTTHLEAGPETVCRTAAAMPGGGLGMLAFLTVFRFSSTWVGLGWATAAAFAAALAVLAVVARLTAATTADGGGTVPTAPARRRHHPHPPRGPARTRGGRAGALRRDAAARPLGRPRTPPGRGIRREHQRRHFSPRVEALLD